VWFNKHALTNIIAFKNLSDLYNITYSRPDRSFYVHRTEHGLPDMQFKMHQSGLHYFDPEDMTSFQFVTTVSGNKAHFTDRQIKGAETARQYYRTLGYPSMKDFRWVIQSNLIKDCPITVADIDIALEIWGPDIAALKGKTSRSKPPIVAPDFVKVPKDILSAHRDVCLAADIFFLNKIPFFLTISRNICFTTVTHLKDRKRETIFKAYKAVHSIYLQRGFKITLVNLAGEFGPLQALIQELGTRANLASAHEHVPEAERRIRVVKERTRAIRYGLPFDRIPRLMTIHVVFQGACMLNFFPTKGGISDTLSPRTLLLGTTLDQKKDFRLTFGDYCQVHKNDTPRNSQAART
jgi:hypothetical protein